MAKLPVKGVGRIISKLKRKKEPEQPIKKIVKATSPEEYRKMRERAAVVENAELMKEILELKKQIQALSEENKRLKDALEKKAQEEVTEQKKVFEKIDKMMSFKWFIIPERPVTIVSAYTNKPFINPYGEPTPYLAGFKFRALEDTIAIDLILSRRPLKRAVRGKTKDMFILRTNPPITIERFVEIFAEPEFLIYRMRHGGVIPVNITENAEFTGSRLPPVEVYVDEGKEAKEEA